MCLLSADTMFRRPSITAEAAAELLRQTLRAPTWAVSVWAWHEGGKVTLIVQVDPAFSLDKARVPDRFEGFEVKTQSRETPIAGHARPHAY
jgi:hypothetical protein